MALLQVESGETIQRALGKQIAKYFGPDDKMQSISFKPVRIIPCNAGLSGGMTTSVNRGWDRQTNKPF